MKICKIENYRSRSDIDIFSEIAASEQVSIVLGHRANKENGVYLIHGIEPSGEIVEFAQILDSIKNDFEHHYNLEIKNELDHDRDYETNNPYVENSGELVFNLFKRIFETNGKDSEVFDEVESMGFKIYNKTEDEFYAADGISIIVDNIDFKQSLVVNLMMFRQII